MRLVARWFGLSVQIGPERDDENAGQLNQHLRGSKHISMTVVNSNKNSGFTYLQKP
jgi:hypothetical protein